MKSTILWDVTLYSLVAVYQCFRGTLLAAILWDVTLYSLVAVYQCFRGTLLAACLHGLLFKPEYRGSMFL
jgi:hypothetical protein